MYRGLSEEQAGAAFLIRPGSPVPAAIAPTIAPGPAFLRVFPGPSRAPLPLEGPSSQCLKPLKISWGNPVRVRVPARALELRFRMGGEQRGCGFDSVPEPRPVIWITPVSV